jgi:hypothetical protein
LVFALPIRPRRAWGSEDVRARIEAAQTAILARIEKLATLPGLHPEERQAIEDALRGLRSLEQEHARDGRRQTPCSEEVPPKTLTGKEHYAGKT